MFIEYFKTFYLERVFGAGYIATTLIFSVGAVCLLRDSRGKKSLIYILLYSAMLNGLGILVDSFLYPLVSFNFMDDMRMVLQLLFFGVFFRSCSAITAVLRSTVYFTCMNLVLPISEPIGDLLRDYNSDFRWAVSLTPVVVAIACVITVLFLRKFSTEKVQNLPVTSTVSMIVISFLGWFLWKLGMYVNPGKFYMFAVAMTFWILLYLFYYMFYNICLQNDQDIRMTAMEQKIEMDQELLDIARNNYEEMHSIRHETKNHLIYLKTLAYRGEWDKLWNYLNHLSSITEEMFNFVECGNDVVNAVMNHAIGLGKRKGVTFDTQLAVPGSLPYDETDFCSLLANLTDNAIDAAAQAEEKVVHVQIYPQRDYLFIRVTNSYNHSISAERRLSLVTTKKDKKLHGYGTKIIRKIAEKYGGSVSISIEDGLFISMVMLELPREVAGGASDMEG